jgi:hypothetical protein
VFVISLITNEVADEKSYGVINLGCSDDATCCGVSPGATAGGNSPDRNSGPSLCVFVFGLGFGGEQKLERVPELAAGLVRLKVDLIVASGGRRAISGEEGN